MKIFYREFGGLHKAAMVLAISSITSALLGLFRDRLLAGTFGAGKTLDIYYSAFKIPDLLYIFSLSIVSVTVLIPFLLERISSNESYKDAHNFLNNIFSIFFTVMTILIVIIFFMVPWLSDFMVPGFSAEEKSQMVLLTRVLLLSPLFLGLSNLLSSVIQSFRRFFIYALSPIFYNIGIIFGILFFLPKWGIKGVAVGVVLGAVMHMGIQIPSIIRLGFIPLFKIKMNFKEAWQVAKLSFPRSMGISLSQFVFIFITAIASFLSAGSIAVFNLSFNLQSVPLTVIGMSYSVAAFPTLARLFVNNQKKEFIEQTISAMRQIIFWSIPVSFMIIVLRAQIIRVIFGHGRFDWNDTKLAAGALALFSVSITAQSLILLFSRAFYAAGRTVKPIVVNAFFSVFIAAGIFIFFKVFSTSHFVKNFFEIILRMKETSGVEVMALPFFFSLGSVLNAFFLCLSFGREFGSVWSHVKKNFSQVFFASLLMAVISYFSLSVMNKIFDVKTTFGIFLQGFSAAVFGMVVWFIVLNSVKNKELGDIIDSLKQKFWKTPVVASEPENIS